MYMSKGSGALTGLSGFWNHCCFVKIALSLYIQANKQRDIFDILFSFTSSQQKLAKRPTKDNQQQIEVANQFHLCDFFEFFFQKQIN